jgi:RNA polymerase sigma-70 factor (ECF subfamily)
MLHCEARRAARRGPDGGYIPLSEQNPQRWSRPLIEEAECHLAEASKCGSNGRFQLEAAIQTVHADRARSERTEWTAIVLFYEHLVRISPTLGTRSGYAAALAEAKGPEAGLAVLDAIDPDRFRVIRLTGRFVPTSRKDSGKHRKPRRLSIGRSAWHRTRR